MANIARSSGAHRGWETRRERDEFAAANIPDALIPLWEKTKLNFRGTPEKRAEKFLQYAHDHEEEGMGAVVDEADRKLEAMIRAHQARERAGGFASLEALVVGLGIVAAGYFAWRALRKNAPRHASPPPRVGMMMPPPWPSSYDGWKEHVQPPQHAAPPFSMIMPRENVWAPQSNYDEWDGYVSSPSPLPYPWPPNRFHR